MYFLLTKKLKLKHIHIPSIIKTKIQRKKTPKSNNTNEFKFLPFPFNIFCFRFVSLLLLHLLLLASSHYIFFVHSLELLQFHYQICMRHSIQPFFSNLFSLSLTCCCCCCCSFLNFNNNWFLFLCKQITLFQDLIQSTIYTHTQT